MPLSTEPTKTKRDPNAEAIAIVTRFAERIEVAQSVFRIVTNLAQQHAAVYVRAAKQAAIHAATNAAARQAANAVKDQISKPNDATDAAR